MALSSAEKQQAYRDRKAKQDVVIAAAKSFVPTPGERQDRAIKHALDHQRDYDLGLVANPYPAALHPGQMSLPVSAGTPDTKDVTKPKKRSW